MCRRVRLLRRGARQRVDLQAARVVGVALLHEAGGVDDYSRGVKVVRERQASVLEKF